MNLIFICGCLEPGKDGVGDYCRRMAGELSRNGHVVSLLALNDRRVENIELCMQKDEQTPIEVMRLPAKLALKIRMGKTQEFINLKNPEWLSFQFVPNSFQRKGLPFKLSHNLNHFYGQFRWHLMIHEPWIEAEKIFSGKKRITGFLQKKILKEIVKKIKPGIVQTSNHYYKEKLKAGGIDSSVLHLPGNIPFCRNGTKSIEKEIQRLGIAKKDRKDWVITGTFGRMRKNVDYICVLKKLIEESNHQGKNLAFLSIGEGGKYSKEVFSQLEKEFKAKILLHQFGNRNHEDISVFFQLLDYGVASVPVHLLGKSGAYSSMREHNLNVLIPSIKGKTKKKTVFSGHQEIFNMKNQEFSVKNVAKQFITSLNSYSTITIKNNSSSNENLVSYS